MTAVPGWYYHQGDPEDTLRRWNGEAWIGFPIAQTGSSPLAPSTVGVKPFRPVAGQVGLEVLSVAVRVALVLVMLAHAFLAFTVFQNSQYDAVAALDTLEPAPTPIVTAFTGVFVIGLLAGMLFIAWFASAYRNLSKWHNTRRSAGWAAIVFFVPFIQFRWPWDMMLELIEKSARAERQGEISPFAVLGWWSMWSAHQTLFLASIGLSRFTDVGPTNYQFAMAGSACAIIGLGCAIFLVGRVTAAQETRRRPTAAQRAIMAKGQMV